MNNGLLQQYAKPLTVYNMPSNIFVGDFVGNPSINYVNAKGKQVNDEIELTIFDNLQVSFKPEAGFDLNKWYQEEKELMDNKAKEHALKEKEKGYVEKENKDTLFKYNIALINDFGFDENIELTQEDFVLGIRPENIEVNDSSNVKASIYSSMPTGMETTIRIAYDNYLLTGVMFGGVVYELGQEVRFDVTGNNVMLFSRKSGRLISLGSLNINK